MSPPGPAPRAPGLRGSCRAAGPVKVAPIGRGGGSGPALREREGGGAGSGSPRVSLRPSVRPSVPPRVRPSRSLPGVRPAPPSRFLRC